MTAYGMGRTRSGSGKGNVVAWHLNPYVNCVHTLVGGGIQDNDGFSSGSV